MIITTNVMYLYSPSCKENVEVIGLLTVLLMEELKEWYHSHKDIIKVIVGPIAS